MKRKTIVFIFTNILLAAFSEKLGIRCTDDTSSGRIWEISFDNLNLELSYN
jgi:hypothetical protein